MVVEERLEPGAPDGRLDQAVRRIAEALHPECIYLFGSRARGDAHADSDYDLMVLVRNPDDSLRRLSQRAYEALYGVGIPIDVLVWTSEYFAWQAPAAASLAATVLREGRLLYAA